MTSRKVFDIQVALQQLATLKTSKLITLENHHVQADVKNFSTVARNAVHMANGLQSLSKKWRRYFHNERRECKQAHSIILIIT
jgi:hypothetical protein